ncbi:MAG: protein-methionine-sulfoxide reductase catalytic subunit MsrP [Gammaproteobacteria bacterium]|nr:protein-methionine-sulfoxide reductase catalytic subunit MsrP [Gammaproteobacteria bacterium]
MLLKVSKSSDVKESQVTDESLYRDRRRFLQASASLTAMSLAPSLSMWPAIGSASIDFNKIGKSDFSIDEETTPYDAVTSYNNFYELGLDKGDPKRNAQHLKVKPWSVKVEGECEKPGEYNLEDFISPGKVEERIYRLRCVEAWSMVIPWVGVELGPILKRFQPTSKAKFVQFKTILDPDNLPGQKRPVLEWPYREGLRIDEAMHPLALLAVGLYGKEMPNQNGAPLRLVMPWKYGFKSIKSIVSIEFTEEQPATSWNITGPREYGFYSNVNPEVDHPRWSQKRERRIGEFLKRETLPFNGYADEVASMYAGMDLKKNF